MTQTAIPAALLFELALLVLAWQKLQDPETPAGEALAKSLALTLAGLGLGILAQFALGLARLPFLPDVCVLSLALAAWRFGRRDLPADARRVLSLLRSEPLAGALVVAALILLGLAVLLPPANWDSMTYNLARVPLMARENSLALENYTTVRQLAFSPGFDLLSFFFLRFGTDCGVAAFSWLAWLAVIVGSYALARQSGDRRFALTVALVVGSLKLLVLQASSTKNDIGAAAMAVACLLGASALLRRARRGDAAFLLACLAFGVSIKTYFVFFAGPFLLALGVLYREELAGMAATAWRASPRSVAAGAAVFGLALILATASQWISLARFGNPGGPADFVALHRNGDGLAGALANLWRYALQIPDLPGAWWGRAATALCQGLLGPGKGPGASMVFGQGWQAAGQLTEDAAWFGLVGGLLAAPAVIAAAFAKNRFARATALGLLGYGLLLSGLVAWFAYNNRFFSLFFAAGAPCLAWARTVWYDKRPLRAVVVGLSVLTLAAAVLLNQDKPLLDGRALPGFDLAPSVLEREGGRRAVYDRHYGGPALLDALTSLPPGRSVLLVAGKDSWVYPLLAGSSHRWLAAGEEHPLARFRGREYDVRDCGQLAELAGHFDLLVVMEFEPAQICLDASRAVLRTRAAWGEVLVFEKPGP